jgi:hypothetical protein
MFLLQCLSKKYYEEISKLVAMHHQKDKSVEYSQYEDLLGAASGSRRVQGLPVEKLY